LFQKRGGGGFWKSSFRLLKF